MTLPRPHKASSPAWSRRAQSAPRSHHGKNCSRMEPTPMVRWRKRTIPSRDWTRRALAFWKGELLPLFGRAGGGAPPLSSLSPRFSSLHQLAHIPGVHVRPSALLVAPFPRLLFLPLSARWCRCGRSLDSTAVVTTDQRAREWESWVTEDIRWSL